MTPVRTEVVAFQKEFDRKFTRLHVRNSSSRSGEVSRRINLAHPHPCAMSTGALKVVNGLVLISCHLYMWRSWSHECLTPDARLTNCTLIAPLLWLLSSLCLSILASPTLARRQKHAAKYSLGEVHIYRYDSAGSEKVKVTIFMTAASTSFPSRTRGTDRGNQVYLGDVQSPAAVRESICDIHLWCVCMPAKFPFLLISN